MKTRPVGHNQDRERFTALRDYRDATDPVATSEDCYEYIDEYDATILRYE
jgi:hypothetical protein